LQSIGINFRTRLKILFDVNQLVRNFLIKNKLVASNLWGWSS